MGSLLALDHDLLPISPLLPTGCPGLRPPQEEKQPLPQDAQSLLSEEASDGQSGPSTSWQKFVWPPPTAQAERLSEIQW